MGKFILGAAFFLCMIFWFMGTAAADEITTLDADHHLHVSFSNFARDRIDLLNNNFSGRPDKLLLEQRGGAFVSSYRQAAPGSLEVLVRKTGCKTSPFIGVMRYTKRTFESNGGCLESSSLGPFIVVRKRNVTEIFRYDRNQWR